MSEYHAKHGTKFEIWPADESTGHTEEVYVFHPAIGTCGLIPVEDFLEYAELLSNRVES